MNTLNELADRAMKAKNSALLRSGIVGPTATAQVGDHTAEFVVATPNELHRARSIAGEAPLLREFLGQLDADMTVWDVGAAVGTWTCFSAPLAGRTKAFEPHPGNVERLRENITQNGLDATVEQIALGGETGKAELAVDGGTGAGTHRLTGSGGRETIPVPVRRGVDMGPAPDAIKVDVEGAELAVLDGLGDHLQRVCVAAVEVHPQYGVAPDEIRERLESAGLSVREVDLGREETHLLGRRG